MPPQQQQKPEPQKPRSRRTISVEYHYDSDFSEGSTPPATDSESDTDSQHDERLAARVPWYCRVPPTLESTQHVWRCPGCGDYRIDLLQPDEDELEEIPEYYAELLRLRNWSKVTEPDVMMAFGYLVNNHYTGHLKALGIQLVTDDNKVTTSGFGRSDILFMDICVTSGFCEKVAGGEEAQVAAIEQGFGVSQSTAMK